MDHTTAEQTSPLRLLPAAASEPPTRWHYWVEFADPTGGGGCEVRLAKQITSHHDVEHVGGLITARTGKQLTVKSYSLLSSPAPVSVRAAKGRPLESATAQVDPEPWHYWVHFEFLTGPAGGGACEVHRTHKIRSGDDVLSLNELITTNTGRPVRVTAHTLLIGPAGLSTVQEPR